MTNYVRKDNSTDHSFFLEEDVHESPSFSSRHLSLSSSLDGDSTFKESFRTFEHVKECSECKEVYFQLNLQKALSSELNRDRVLPEDAENRLWQVLNAERDAKPKLSLTNKEK